MRIELKDELFQLFILNKHVLNVTIYVVIL